MEELGVETLLLFGYLSIALAVGALFRSQLKFFQDYLIPGSIIGGFFLLIIGPELFNIVNIPVGKVDSFVYHLITFIFLILGLRGFGSRNYSHKSSHKHSARDSIKSTAKTTLLITHTLAFQLILGLLFVLFIIFLINPELFSGFGSMLMLGQGFDQVISRFFAGFWEQDLGFIMGRSVAFNFAAFGFLFAYVIGLIYLIRARKKGLITSFFAEEEKNSFRTGIIPPGEQEENAGKLTSHFQSIETFALHLSVIGSCLLILYVFMRLASMGIIAGFGSGAVIIGEIIVNFNFLFALLLGLAARSLMRILKIDYILDDSLLTRLVSGGADYLIVAAIVAIPLVIVPMYQWEIILLSLLGAVLTLTVVKLLLEKVYGEKGLDKQLALFGFLTGNISSALALLRIFNPNLEGTFVRDLTFAGALGYGLAMPLFYIMNVPMLGAIGYIILAIILTVIYALLLYLVWSLATKTASKASPKKLVPAYMRNGKIVDKKEIGEIGQMINSEPGKKKEAMECTDEEESGFAQKKDSTYIAGDEDKLKELFSEYFGYLDKGETVFTPDDEEELDKSRISESALEEGKKEISSEADTELEAEEKVEGEAEVEVGTKEEAEIEVESEAEVKRSKKRPFWYFILRPRRKFNLKKALRKQEAQRVRSLRKLNKERTKKKYFLSGAKRSKRKPFWYFLLRPRRKFNLKKALRKQEAQRARRLRKLEKERTKKKR